jgi:hypothetical protein
MAQSTTTSCSTLPPSSELFNKHLFVQRHPTLLTPLRVEWALRNREINGLMDMGGVFETRGGELYIHEPTFLAWFLGLDGRNKPRSSRRPSSQRSAA